MPKVQAPQPKAKPAYTPAVKVPSVPKVSGFKEIKLKPPEEQVHVTLMPKLEMEKPPAAAALPEKPPMPEPAAEPAPALRPPEPAPAAAPAEEPKKPAPAPEAPAASSPIASVNRETGVFKFYCPACQQKLSAQIDWQGKTIHCPACKTDITIPTLP